MVPKDSRRKLFTAWAYAQKLFYAFKGGKTQMILAIFYYADGTMAPVRNYYFKN